MSILIIGLVLILVHLSGPTWAALRKRLFGWYFQLGFTGVNRLRLPGRVALLLVLALPVLVLGALQWQLLALTMTWPWFMFSLLLLLIAWGSRDLGEDVRHYLDAPTPEQAQLAAEPLLASYRHAADAPVDEETVIRGVFYQGLVRWFGVMFWFLLLGAAGALLFRLPHALLGHRQARERISPEQRDLARDLAAIVDLVPAALTTLSLAIVGNFDAVIGAWRRHLQQHRSPLALDSELLPDVGFRAVCEGEPVDDAFAHEPAAAGQTDVARAMSLVWRALMGWLTVVALLVLAGLVS